MRVAFFKFSELVEETKKLSTPWLVLHGTPDTLVIGKTDLKFDIEIKVVFNSSFVPMVTYKGKLLKYSSSSFF